MLRAWGAAQQPSTARERPVRAARSSFSDSGRVVRKSVAEGSTPRLDGTLALPGGRRIGLAEFGAREGPVLFSFHAGMSSRLDAAWADAAGRCHGVRVIGLDRPGIGRSDPRPDWCLSDWPGDVSAVADALGVDRFAVVGWSSGGVYALACAAAIPQRLRGVGVIACLAPVGVRELGRFDRGFTFLARRAPVVLRAVGALVAGGLRAAVVHPSVVGRASRVVGEADGRVVADLGVQALVPFHEAFRPGSKGVIYDEVLVIEPWGFDLEDLTSVVHLWQGDADRFASPAEARSLAEHLPHGVLHEYPGEGHFLAYTHASEIVTVLGTS